MKQHLAQAKALDESIQRNQTRTQELHRSADQFEETLKQRNADLDQIPRLLEAVGRMKDRFAALSASPVVATAVSRPVVDSAGASSPAHSPAKGTMLGIDVSSHNAGLDYKRLRSEGVSFVYIKATEGASTTDPKYAAIYRDARNAGLLYGAYHFLRAGDPQSQAENFAHALEQEQTDLPPAIAFEPSSVGPSPSLV